MERMPQCLCWLPFMLLTLLVRSALADVESGGFITQSQGEIIYQAAGTKDQSLPAFSRLSAGSRVKLGDMAKLQIVYLRGGRQETWIGKAQLEIGEAESMVVGQSAGSLAVKILQPFMVETLVKSNAVMGNMHTRQSMIRVRSLMTASKVKDAEDRYVEIRLQAAEDDITPEIFLLTTLDGLKAYQSMKKPLAEMLRRQPDNAAAKALHDHFMLLLNTGTVEATPSEPGAK